MSLYTFSGLCPSAEGTQLVTGACEAADEVAARAAADDAVMDRYGLAFKTFTYETHEHAIRHRESDGARV